MPASGTRAPLIGRNAASNGPSCRPMCHQTPSHTVSPQWMTPPAAPGVAVKWPSRRQLEEEAGEADEASGRGRAICHGTRDGSVSLQISLEVDVVAKIRLREGQLGRRTRRAPDVG